MGIPRLGEAFPSALLVSNLRFGFFNDDLFPPICSPNVQVYVGSVVLKRELSSISN
jgi:hypothetical protein